MASFDPEEQRRLLELSFEPQGDDFLYYHWRWSRGVPVSAAEREAYLDIPMLGSRRAWRRSIEGRPTAAPRASGPALRKLLAHMPPSYGLLLVLFGIGEVIAAWRAPSLPGVIAHATLGCVLLALTVWFALTMIAARR